MDNTRRVLVVEDEGALLDMLHRGLTRSGFSCVCAASAEEARAALQGERFDAMITDVCMAGMSGIELTRWARAHRPEVPVLVMSGSGNPNVCNEAYEAGAAGFVDKPFTLSDLVSRLRAIAGGGPPLTPRYRPLIPPKVPRMPKML